MSKLEHAGQFTCAVKVQHLPDQSDPQNGLHAYAYTVTIVNTGEVTAQLVARRWLITNGHGDTEEVRGLAVVGHQPVLKPGEQFEYTSWVRLETPMGTMRGTFFCMTEQAQAFEATIGEFMLAPPQALH
ncbi:MAG: Co2+/Mg2+ efflux protein ApaG [Burkholderiaceae bacterium]|jgi:ApaG protein